MEWICRILREPNNVIALATVAYVVVAACTLIVICLQARTASRQAEIAARQVTISESMLNLERPWVVADILDHGVFKLLNEPFECDDPAARTFGADLGTLATGVSLLNQGKGPAWIIRGSFNCEVLDLPLPAEPTYQNVETFPDVTVVPGAAPSIARPLIKIITPAIREDIHNGRRCVAVFGSISYRDALGTAHETRYCWMTNRTELPGIAPGVPPRVLVGFGPGGPPNWTRYT